MSSCFGLPEIESKHLFVCVYSSYQCRIIKPICKSFKQAQQQPPVAKFINMAAYLAKHVVGNQFSAVKGKLLNHSAFSHSLFQFNLIVFNNKFLKILQSS